MYCVEYLTTWLAWYRYDCFSTKGLSKGFLELYGGIM